MTTPCKQEKKLSTILTMQKVILTLVAVFVTLVAMAFKKADEATEKVSKVIEKTAEINVIKNDVQWIKEHLKNNKPKKAPKGILPKAIGKVTKINPGPAPGVK